MPSTSAFARRVQSVVASIPAGQVLTYGEVAAEAGAPGAARAVGNVLAAAGASLPWWRVVAATGRLVPGLEEGEPPGSDPLCALDARPDGARKAQRASCVRLVTARMLSSCLPDTRRMAVPPHRTSDGPARRSAPTAFQLRTPHAKVCSAATSPHAPSAAACPNAPCRPPTSP
ncbi:MAG: MGMT family protein [Nitriliruptoraceae bacterium]